MEPVAITDPADPRVADYLGLRDPAQRRLIESDEFFIAEGTGVIERLLASPFSVRSVLVTPRRYDRMEPLLRSLQCPVYVAERDMLARVAGFDLHRGAVAAANRGVRPAMTDVLATSHTIAVLEGLNDVENLGAIIRSARALGVDGLVLDPTCADPFYRRTVRVSMGEVLFLPIARAVDWPGDLQRIAAAGFRLLALTPARDAVAIDAIRRDVGDRIAVIFGTEGAGLSAATLRVAERVRIPIRDDVDSLNVGHAAAIAFATLATPH